MIIVKSRCILLFFPQIDVFYIILYLLFRSSLVKLLCGLYALIIVVLGIVFAVATSLTAKEREHKYYLEVIKQCYIIIIVPVVSSCNRSGSSWYAISWVHNSQSSIGSYLCHYFSAVLS